MSSLTTHERMERILAHREADRVPIVATFWSSTLKRWQREGLPPDVHPDDYFGLDKIVRIHVDNSPRYEERVLEETDDYVIRTTAWGATLKQWKKHGGVPQFLDFRIKDPQAWQEAKARMEPTPDRIDWQMLKNRYAKWREQGAWIHARFWFGFDVTHSWVVGTERLLMALVTDPEWVVDMFNHCLDMNLALFEQIWQAGYHFDEIGWCDDLGYKGHQFFSVDTYRELLKPVHKRAAAWAHAKGIKVSLHSCGDVSPFVPEFIDIGVDSLNPLEVKAGMDPVGLKKAYGHQLSFEGGINSALFPDEAQLREEMEKVIPVMKENGGYIVGPDHSVPDGTSLETMEKFVQWAKQLGAY